MMLGRLNYSSFVAMKKSGTANYVNPDGKPSNPDIKASGTTGDCVVLKDGVLISASCDQPAFFICENKLVNGTQMIFGIKHLFVFYFQTKT